MSDDLTRKRDPTYVVAKAVFDRLRGDITTASVYTMPPQDASMPFLSVTQWTVSPLGNKTGYAQTVTALVNVYSAQQESVKECVQLKDAVIQSLSRAPLTLEDGWTCVFGELEMTEQLAEPTDEYLVVQHGVVRFRWILNSEL